MEILRNDLKNIQGGLKELLNRVGPLEVPSWRFPEKVANSVSIEEVLNDVSFSNGDSNNKILILELVVDRLLLLLQCCMKVSEQSFGHRSAGLPLTLGSTVKKFSKRVLLDSNTVQRLNNEISSKTESISSLESSLHTVHEENKLLKLTQVTTSPKEPPRNEPRTNTEPIVSRPSTSSSSLIPYDAMGTLRISSLSSVSDSKSFRSMESVKSSVFHNPLDPPLTETSPLLEVPLSVQKIHDLNTTQSRCCHVSTQTTVTAFALCARCSDTHAVLVNAANSVVSVFSKHGQKSIMASTNWSAMAEVGGLVLEGWKGSFDSDLNGLDVYCQKQQERISRLVSERELLQETVGKMESELQLLGSQIESLQVSIEEIKQTNASSVTKTNQKFTDKLKQLEMINAKLEERYQKTKDQLNSAQRQEASLKSLTAELERRYGQLQNDLQVALHREIQMLSSKELLEKELSCSKVELESCREQFDSNKLELSKTRVYKQTIEKRNKSLQAKQLRLLSRLDELDQECTSLGEELQDAKGRRDQLVGEVEQIKKECETLKDQLEEERVQLLESNQEQEHLVEVVSELETKLKGVKEQLEDEKHNCRLLMDYPFVKQTSEDYPTHISLLKTSVASSQKQISANTIRILLLEEQNTDLRQTIVKGAQEVKRKTSTGKTSQLKQPVQMWKTGLLSELNAELMLAREASSRIDQSHVGDHQQTIRQTEVQSAEHPPCSNTSSHKRNVQSATEASSLSQTTRSSSRRNQSYHTTGQSSSSSKRPKLNRQPVRPSSSSGKLKGRLGDLVAAIEEAHRTSSASLSTSVFKDDSKTSISLPPPAERQVWMDETMSSSSLDIVEMYVCNNCDRMYHDRLEFEQHYTLCQT